MKRYKQCPAAKLLGVLMILLATASLEVLNAQISISGGTANVDPPTGGFAIDGNLQADTPVSGVGDWVPCQAFPNTCAAGFVLNNNGSTVTEATTYHLTELWDNSGDNIYTKGKANTNPNDNVNYKWGSGKAVGKCDMNHALIHFTTDSNGHVWVVFAADRLVNTGSSYMDFEFLQNSLIKNDNGTFTSEGPDGGRTVEDFILTIAFGNGGAQFQLLRWEAVGSGFDYVIPPNPIPEGVVYAAYNLNQIPSPYQVFGNNYYISNSFIEAAVDLTSLLGTLNPCIDLVVKTIFVKTKVSAGGNSGVEDFFTPLQVNNISLGNAYAGPDDIVCPGESYNLNGEANPSPGYNLFSVGWESIEGFADIEFDYSENPSEFEQVLTSPVLVGNEAYNYAKLRLTVVTTDASNNQCSVDDDVDITAEDLTKPTITCVSNQIKETDPFTCTYTVAGTEFDPTAFSDNCTGSSILNDFNSSNTLADAVFPEGTTTVTWTVTDNSTNTKTCSFDVRVNDSEDPVITCATPAASYTADPNTCTYTVPGTALDPIATSDNCTIASVINSKTGTSTLQGAVFPLGSTLVTWTITDGSGNTATCQFEIVVVDTQNPVILCATPATNYPADPNVCTYTVPGTALNPVSATDNCSVASVINNKTGTSTLQGAVFSLGSTPVTWTITDGSGNTASCQFNVVVVDTQNPTITCATPATSYPVDPNVCTYTVPGTALNPVATGDNCSVALVTNNKTGTSTLQGAVFPLGNTPVTWTITDGSGNTTTCQYNIVVVDTQNPAITCATPLTSYPADPNVCTYTVPGTALNPVATGDNCSVASVTNNKTGTSTLQGAVFPLGNTPVTWTITDGSGNTATCSYTIHVIDTQNPTITCATPATSYPADPNVCTYTVPGTALNPAATGDNCSIASVINSKTGTSTLQGAVFPLGNTPVTWTITDGSGNTATCSYTVHVIDTQNPTITCATPAASYPANPNVCTYTVPGTALNPVATGDNCSVASVTNSKNGTSTLQGAVFPLGNTTVTWTITDGSGNTTTCNYTIHVVDTQNPTITCPVPAASYPAGTNVCSYTVPGTALNPVATGDNCSVASLINNKTGTSTLQGAVFPLGSTMVTWTITDGSGNTATCSYAILVVDTQAPRWITTAGNLDRTVNCNDAAGLAAAQLLYPVAADNCDNDVTDIVKTSGNYVVSGTCPMEGTFTNTWIVTDNNGNTSPVYSQVITIADNTAPTFTPPANIVVAKGAGCSSNIDPSNTGSPVGLTDNCDPNPVASWSDETCYSTTVTGQMNHGVGYYYPIIIDGYTGFTASDLQKVFMSFSTQKGKGNVEFTLIAPSGDGIMLIGPYCEGGQCDNLNGMTTYTPNFYPYSSGYTKWVNSNYIAPGGGSFTPYAGTSTVNSIAEIEYLERYVTKFEDLSGPMNGTWILYGRKWGSSTGTMSFNGICLTPVDCSYDDLIVRTWTASDACGNTSNSYYQTIVIRDITAPVWTTTQGSLDRQVQYGDAAALAAAQLLFPVASDNCDNDVTNIIKTSGSFVAGYPCSHGGTYTNNWTVSDACGNTSAGFSQVITILDNHNVSGVITYNNVYNTPMDMVSLSLYRGSSMIANTTTSSTGYYQFNNLTDGTYRIEPSITKSSGGVNSLDAGQVNYWWTHLSTIEHVKWDAGNFVSGDNFINATDAGSIQSYFVNGTPLPTPGYWTFYKAQITSDKNPPTSQNTFDICGNHLVQDYYVLCVGDFSRNFIPSAGAKSSIASSLQLRHDGTIKASALSVVDLPVRVTTDMQLTALSLILNIPTQLVSVEDVVMRNGNDLSVPGKLDWAIHGTELRIGWNSPVPVDFATFSDLITLRLKTTDYFKPGSPVEIELVNDPLNELADGLFESIDNAILQTVTLEAYTTGIVVPGDEAPFDLICQPNPFYEVTVLEYTLPQSGEVVLDLVNKYGQRVSRLVNSYQDKGKYVTRVEGINLDPGVYTVTLHLHAGGDLKMKTIKIVRGW